MGVELAGLGLADAPERWVALGFEVTGDGVDLGGVRVELGQAGGPGIVSWTLRGASEGEIDGLVTMAAPAGVAAARPDAGAPARPDAAAAPHPNGAIGLDHVVVLSPDFDRTAAALDAACLPLRRVRDAAGFRQGFRRLGPAILELVEARDAPPGPAQFWGLVVVVADLEALARRLGDQLGTVRDAVQPRRRIATLRSSAGLGLAVAFMDPEVPEPEEPERGASRPEEPERGAPGPEEPDDEPS